MQRAPCRSAKERILKTLLLTSHAHRQPGFTFRTEASLADFTRGFYPMVHRGICGSPPTVFTHTVGSLGCSALAGPCLNPQGRSQPPSSLTPIQVGMTYLGHRNLLCFAQRTQYECSTIAFTQRNGQQTLPCYHAAPLYGDNRTFVGRLLRRFGEPLPDGRISCRAEGERQGAAPATPVAPDGVLSNSRWRASSSSVR